MNTKSIWAKRKVNWAKLTDEQIAKKYSTTRQNVRFARKRHDPECSKHVKTRTGGKIDWKKDPDWRRSDSELSEILGVTRQAVSIARKRESAPDSPKPKGGSKAVLLDILEERAKTRLKK